ncbi:MAG: precorrin-6A/cobalt-precorrin-6A reductase [Roseobacter sp.]
MTKTKTILVMAGSREAHDVVRALLACQRRVIASLSEPERMFADLPVPTRLGSFETDEDIAVWLAESHVSVVLDASHVFEGSICNRVCKVCKHNKIAYVRVLRPTWTPAKSDNWHRFETISKAVENLPENSRVFTNTGWPTLPDYAGFQGEKLHMRQTHASMKPAPYPFLDYVEGTPPFSQLQEETLFTELGITHLICRNVGGAASMSKVLAARALQLPVFMLSRPSPPEGATIVESVSDALRWEASL